MRSCGKRLLIVFALVQLAKCIYSQQQDGINDANAELNVLLMEQVEGSGTISPEKSSDCETTLNPTLNPTVESIDETTTILTDENSTNTQTETTRTTSVKNQWSTLSSEADATEEAELQLTDKPKCLCDCETGDLLETTQNQPCSNLPSNKKYEDERKDDIEESESMINVEKETNEQISVTYEPRMTEVNEITYNAAEPQTVSEKETHTDSATKSQEEAQTDSPTEAQIGTRTDSPIDSQTTRQEEAQTDSASENLVGLTEHQAESQTEPNSDTQTESQTVEPIETTTLAPPLGKPCTSAGDFPFEDDCELYYTCVAQPDETSTIYERTEKSCPAGNAFNSELGRCTRDISSCNDGSMPCETSGTFADPQGNSSYYWCVTRLNSGIGSFHKYRVQCPIGEVYVPQLGKCFIDINNLQNLPANWGQDGESDEDDEDIIKAELKQFKLTEKARLKEQKLKDKMEQKLQKELAKKAAKEAKEQAKLKGASKEVEQFVCTEEGNFASALSMNRYFACISKKGKFKVVSMKCTMGNVFDPVHAVCIPNNINSYDDDDD